MAAIRACSAEDCFLALNMVVINKFSVLLCDVEFNKDCFGHRSSKENILKADLAFMLVFKHCVGVLQSVFLVPHESHHS